MQPVTEDRGHVPSPFDGAAEDRAAWVKLCNLQRRILPSTAPEVPGYKQVLTYRPAFVVTGDYHDFFKRQDGRRAVFVGDGSGHGPAASMLMAIMRTILQTHPELHGTPGETLAGAGRLFHRLLPPDLFMTGVYLILGEDGEVSWASAGHHPPVRVAPGGEAAPVDLAPVGDVLGFSEESRYDTVTWRVAPGERLFLFTDGLWDARDSAGDPYGRQRLFRDLAGARGAALEEAISGVVARVVAHLEGADVEDDFTFIGIERHPESEDRS